MSKDRYSDDHAIELMGDDGTFTLDAKRITFDSGSGASFSGDGTVTAYTNFNGSANFNDVVGISSSGDFVSYANAALVGNIVDIGDGSATITLTPDAEEPVTINGNLVVTGSISGSVDFEDVSGGLQINSDEAEDRVYGPHLLEHVTGKFLGYNDGIVWVYFNEFRTITGVDKLIQINLINQ